MRILVTGGAGFLGSHLCKRLCEDGHQVICLDNLQTGHAENVAGLFDKYQLEFVEHDVIEPYDFKVDQIYNLACAASPVHYQAKPIHTTMTSVLGVKNALDLAVRTGARVFHSSTSEVYGDPEVHPQTEDYRGSVNPIGPRACYDEGKRCAESLLFDYRRMHNADIRVVRIFNTYGPKMDIDDGRVVSNFIAQALRGDDLTLYGDGSQTRSFCFVSDLIEGFVRFMNQEDEVGPINLGNPTEYTVRQLAETILELVGRDGKLAYKPLPDDDPRQRKPDIELAKKVIAFAPDVSLKDGLLATIDNFRTRLS